MSDEKKAEVKVAKAAPSELDAAKLLLKRALQEVTPKLSQEILAFLNIK